MLVVCGGEGTTRKNTLGNDNNKTLYTGNQITKEITEFQKFGALKFKVYISKMNEEKDKN